MHEANTTPSSTSGITLVLGSGGARGFCFIGVLKALDEKGILIKRIVGASMGSIVGAAYLLGNSPARLEEIARNARPGLLPFLSPRGPGVLTSRTVRKLAEKFVPAGLTFSDLSAPLSVICTDYRSGHHIEISSGDLQSAVIGSSVAGAIFSPVERDGTLLIDGGYSAPVPVQYTDAADVVVAVSAMVDPAADQSGRMGLTFSNLIPGWRLSREMIRMFDIQGHHLALAQLDDVDHIEVKPELGALKFTEFGKHAFAIECGYQAMMARLPDIQKRLSVS